VAPGGYQGHPEPGEQPVVLEDHAAFQARAVDRLAIDQDVAVEVAVEPDDQPIARSHAALRGRLR
jgi:hypothetical protein